MEESDCRKKCSEKGIKKVEDCSTPKILNNFSVT